MSNMRVCLSHALLCGLLALGVNSGCRPTPSPEKPAPKLVTTGIVDWSGWQKWVQSPPRLVLLDGLDPQTEHLIKEQTSLFKTLIAEPKPSASTQDVAGRLEQLKTSFLTTAYTQRISAYTSDGDSFVNEFGEISYRTRSASINIPHIDRWDRYRGTIQGLQPANLPTVIIALERQAKNDLQDLEHQRGSGGPVGLQARADVEWILNTLQPFVAQLKATGTPSSKGPQADLEQTKQRWGLFETNELQLLKRVIAQRTKTETIADDDGTFLLDGEGRLCAIITVAGRELYFPADTRDIGLRFLNVRTEPRQAAP